MLSFRGGVGGGGVGWGLHSHIHLQLNYSGEVVLCCCWGCDKKIWSEQFRVRKIVVKKILLVRFQFPWSVTCFLCSSNHPRIIIQMIIQIFNRLCQMQDNHTNSAVLSIKRKTKRCTRQILQNIEQSQKLTRLCQI